MAALGSGSSACVFRQKTSFGSLEIYPDYRAIPAVLWEKFFGAHWKNHLFLQLVETTLRENFEYLHLVLSDSNGNVIGLQPGFITRQDLALGFPETLRRCVVQLRQFFPSFLFPKMLFLGSPAANGRLGGTTSATFVAEAALLFAKKRKISLVTFKEFPQADRPSFRGLQSWGFASLASYPGVVLELDFQNFDEYLERHVGKATRKGLRRKFRSLEDRPPLKMECVADISPHLPRLQALYLQVFQRAEEKFECLNAEFFAAVALELPDRARFFLWWQSEKIVAFSLCFVHDGVFYDDYIGLDDSLAHELHLYYVTFRDQLEWALAAGLRTYYSTPMSYEPKLRLGFRLCPLDLYVRHTSPLLNRFYGRLARAAAPTAHDPHLSLFPNFADLDPENRSNS